MKRQFYRRRLLALSTAVLLGLSSLFPSIAGATEITAEEPAVTDTVDPAASTDTSNPASADTVETADGETTEETTEPERLEPDAYFEPIQSNDTADNNCKNYPFDGYQCTVCIVFDFMFYDIVHNSSPHNPFSSY